MHRGDKQNVGLMIHNSRSGTTVHFGFFKAA